MKLLLAFLGLLYVFLLSCKKDETRAPKPIKQDGLWPLNLGSEWTYKRIFYRSDGTVESFADEQTKLTDTQRVRGQLYFGNKQTGLYMTNAGPNVVRGIAADSSLTDPYAIIFQRVFQNDSVLWRIDDPACFYNQSFRGFTGTTLVLGQDCIRNERLTLSCNGTVRGRTVFYLKPGVGLVKYEEHIYNQATASTMLRVAVELQSYKLVD